MACECFTRVLAPETDEHIVLFRRGGHVLFSYHNQLHLTRKKNLQNTSEENRNTLQLQGQRNLSLFFFLGSERNLEINNARNKLNRWFQLERHDRDLLESSLFWWWSGFEPRNLHILCIVPNN